LMAVAALVLSVVVAQSRSLMVHPPLPPHILTGAELQQEVEPGISMRQWLVDRLPSSSTIVSVNGQAVHYLLKRPVVCITEPDNSNRQLDEAAIHAQMKQFSARYLLLFPGDDSFGASSQKSIPFMRTLILGNVPDWLKLAASTRNTMVFECGDCGPTAHALREK